MVDNPDPRQPTVVPLHLNHASSGDRERFFPNALRRPDPNPRLWLRAPAPAVGGLLNAANCRMRRPSSTDLWPNGHT